MFVVVAACDLFGLARIPIKVLCFCTELLLCIRIVLGRFALKVKHDRESLAGCHIRQHLMETLVN